MKLGWGNEKEVDARRRVGFNRSLAGLQLGNKRNQSGHLLRRNLVPFYPSTAISRPSTYHETFLEQLTFGASPPSTECLKASCSLWLCHRRTATDQRPALSIPLEYLALPHCRGLIDFYVICQGVAWIQVERIGFPTLSIV